MAYALLKWFTQMTELVHLTTVIDPTFTSRTSTFQVEVGVLYLLSLVCELIRTRDWRLQWWSRHPMVRTVQRDGKLSSKRALHIWLVNQLPLKCSRRTDRPNFTRWFLTASFKSSAQKYVEARCCLARNGKGWSVRLGGSSVMYKLCILMLGFYQGNGKQQNGTSILKPTSYKPLSETGWKDIWITTWPLHQPWCRQTGTTKPSHLDLKSRNRKWYVVYACVSFP